MEPLDHKGCKVLRERQDQLDLRVHKVSLVQLEQRERMVPQALQGHKDQRERLERQV